MKKQNEALQVLIERQLDLETNVVEALENLNNEMSSLLDGSGIYGPTEKDLAGLSPLVDELRERQTRSHESRESLDRWSESQSSGAEHSRGERFSMRSMIGRLPATKSTRLHDRRQQIFTRLQVAQQKLTANQVVIFYSTEFHRRYLLGVLQCDVDEANYKADGQAFKLPPEKIIGRNC